MADTFCVFDDVQFEKKGFDNRNRIKTSQGVQWLTVPVETAGKFDQLCKDVRVVDNGWRRKHLKSIELAYSRAEYFSEYFGLLEDILATRKHKFLADINFEILLLGLRAFGLAPAITRAQDHSFCGTKSELVLDMCVQLGADQYVFGGKGSSYADRQAFKKAGVVPRFMTFHGVEYSQLHGPYTPNLAFIDLLFNEGPRAHDILISSRADITTT